jgi:hypothetical protein
MTDIHVSCSCGPGGGIFRGERVEFSECNRKNQSHGRCHLAAPLASVHFMELVPETRLKMLLKLYPSTLWTWPHDVTLESHPVRLRWGRQGSYLVDSASSHMLVSKIKPCKSKYKQSYCETANGSLNQLSFI